MSDDVFLDTNVLVYALDPADPVKQARAAAIIRGLENVGCAHISTQVLQELWSALRRGASPIATAERAEAAVVAASALRVVQVTVPLVLEAIARARLSRLSLWDALIVGAAKSARCARILSEDLNDGQVIDGVTVENPFRAAVASGPGDFSG